MHGRINDFRMDVLVAQAYSAPAYRYFYLWFVPGF
jgi:hypothetical protein